MSHCRRFLLRPTVLLAAIAASAPAQVSATATVNSGVLTFQAGSVPPATATIPAGTAVPSAPLTGRITTWPDIVAASSTNGVSVDARRVSLTLSEAIVCGGTASASLTSALWLQVTSARLVPATLELTWTIAPAAGSPLPIVEVDLDGDGIFELRAQANSTVRRSLQLSGTRLVRLRSLANAVQSSPGSGQSMRQDIEVRLVPNWDVTVLPILAPCSNTTMEVAQTFVRGVSIRSGLGQALPSQGATFLVIGFSTLFAPMPGSPLCFLLPNTDIVVPFPAAPLLLDAGLLGPQQFFVQYPIATTEGVFVRF
jgi:hypothetical protein